VELWKRYIWVPKCKISPCWIGVALKITAL